MPSQYPIVVKVSGSELDDNAWAARLVQVIKDLRSQTPVVLVHGGGKETTSLMERLGYQATFIQGLRVTDDNALSVAEMVLSGRANKRLVADFINAGVIAAGISGVDGGLVRVQKMAHPSGDLGWVGDVVKVDTGLIRALLLADILPVVSPISLGLDGHTYNVNADHVARALGAALQASRVIFVSNVPGVMVAGRVVRAVHMLQAEEWIDEMIITGGMIPKIRSAVAVVEAGVSQAVITDLEGLASGEGTAIIK